MKIFISFAEIFNIRHAINLILYAKFKQNEKSNNRIVVVSNKRRMKAYNTPSRITQKLLAVSSNANKT